MSVGIVGYGAYVPHRYVLANQVLKKSERLGLSKKALAAWDEDSVTMAVEAGLAALLQSGVAGDEVGAVYVGSESPPYAVNPSSTIVADILGAEGGYKAVDLQFACKAATAGLQMAIAEVQKAHITHGLVIGSDKSQAQIGDVLEGSAGAAAAAVVVGSTKVIAKVEDMMSYSSDTPDFWRRSGQLHPSHGGRFTGEAGYFAHVLPIAKKMMNKHALAPNDIDHVVFHMPNGIFPMKAAENLGFKKEQYNLGLTVKEIGNPYSASTLMGLTATLDVVPAHKRILMIAYGSGAGADALLLSTTPWIEKINRGHIQSLFENRVNTSRVEYLERWRWE